MEMSEELRAARLEQDLKLCQISKEISSHGSSTRDEYSMVSSSMESNMDSVKINDAVALKLNENVPVVKMPSLFQPFPPKTEAVPAPDSSLPAPLLPENMDPTILLPELQPRTPAPYSSRASAEHSLENPPEPENLELECPLCEERFVPGSQDLLQRHVDHHLEDVVECPLCGKTYDKKNQAVYEEHVQNHFTEETQSLDIRGWDLGID